LPFFGTAILVIIVAAAIGIGIGVVVYKGNVLDAESKAFVDSAVPAIAASTSSQ
jgi:hypothetical protein